MPCFSINRHEGRLRKGSRGLELRRKKRKKEKRRKKKRKRS